MRLPILPLFPDGGMPPAGTLKFVAGSHKFGKRCGQWLTYRATFGGVRTTSSSSPSTPNLYGVHLHSPPTPDLDLTILFRSRDTCTVFTLGSFPREVLTSVHRVRSVATNLDDEDDVVVTTGFNPRLLTSEVTDNHMQSCLGLPYTTKSARLPSMASPSWKSSSTRASDQGKLVSGCGT